MKVYGCVDAKGKLIDSGYYWDLGRGKYLTPHKTECEKWRKLHGLSNNKVSIKEFNIDENKLNRVDKLEFRGYTRDWVNYVLKHRSEKCHIDHDIVIGPCVDATTFDNMEVYMCGYTNRQELCDDVKDKKHKQDVIVIKTDNGMGVLRND